MDPEKLLREVGRELRRAHERAATIPHHGERALERESVLIHLLNQRLPTRFRATRGFVLFESGIADQQIDCLIYDALNFGTRSNMAENTVALCKSVAVLFFETANLTRRKFSQDVKDIEQLKLRFESDQSHDPFTATIHT